MLRLFTLLDLTGFVLNFATLRFVVNTFDLKTHVFALIFSDALLSTFASLSATVVKFKTYRKRIARWNLHYSFSLYFKNQTTYVLVGFDLSVPKLQYPQAEKKK
jgi:hypothetical protein